MNRGGVLENSHSRFDLNDVGKHQPRKSGLAMRGLVAACALLAMVVLLGICRGCLTSSEMTVFVNEAEHIGGAECVWHGRQYFDITLDQFTTRISIVPVNTEISPLTMTVLVKASGADHLDLDFIEIQLIDTDDKGENREIQISSETLSPQISKGEDGRFRSCYQQYRVSEDLSKLTAGHLSLVWNMDYRDGKGEVIHISIKVPLRMVKIEMPFNIVNLDRGGNGRHTGWSGRYLERLGDSGTRVARWTGMRRTLRVKEDIEIDCDWHL